MPYVTAIQFKSTPVITCNYPFILRLVIMLWQVNYNDNKHKYILENKKKKKSLNICILKVINFTTACYSCMVYSVAICQQYRKYFWVSRSILKIFIKLTLCVFIINSLCLILESVSYAWKKRPTNFEAYCDRQTYTRALRNEAMVWHHS